MKLFPPRIEPRARSARRLAAALLLAGVPAAPAVEAVAVLNEIQYNPAGAGEPEWLELRNLQSTDVDLTGWRLTGGVNYTFPTGSVIRTGGFLVLSGNPPALQTSAGITGVIGPWTGSLNNAGETLRLRDLSGRLMDEVSYNDRGVWPAGADGSGMTLARRSGHIAGQEAGSWAASPWRGGSPGADNAARRLLPPETVFDAASPWLYNQTSAGLPAGWAAAAYSAGTGDWLSGTGLLAFGNGTLPDPVGTLLANPAAHPSGTYYFQKQFSFTGDPAQSAVTLRGLWDDGAVIYLNGQEVARRGMPAGTITAASPASDEVGTAGFTAVSLPSALLSPGVNTISVEVHQAGRLLTLPPPSGNLTLVQTGGSELSLNYSRQAGAEPFAKDVLGNGSFAPTHTIANLTNGTYGNPSSWIGDTAGSFCGVRFGSSVNVGQVAWGRDNTGAFADRTAGTYTLEYTQMSSPGAGTPATGNPATGWAVIGTVNYPSHTQPYSLRNVYSLTNPVMATGLRLTVPGTGISSGSCVDELEAGPPLPPPVPVFRLMSTGGLMNEALNLALTGTAFAKDVLPGYPAHTIPHLNDGKYGNDFSWIGNTLNSYAGVSFTSSRSIGRVAFGRDNTGGYSDRSAGSYTVQYTTVNSPGAATPAASWTSIGTINIDASIPSPALRHVFEFAPVNATGIRIIAPGNGGGSGACIDEIELYAPVAPDIAWGASLETRLILPEPQQLPIRLSEIGGTDDFLWRVELENTGTAPFDIGGLILAHSGAPLAGYTFPAQILAPGQRTVIDHNALGFRPARDGRLFLLTAGRAGLVDAAVVRNTLRAKHESGRWLAPAEATFGLPNLFSLHTSVVISEVMYHFPGSAEEWIELHNRSDNPVDLSSWRLADAVTFTFPFGTTIPPRGYLVVSNGAAGLQTKWPAVADRIIGNFSGSLSNGGERIVLEDVSGNPADEFTYGDGGKWPALADGGGSSLELRDTDADNAQPGAWAASDETGKSSWQTFTWRAVSAQSFGPSFWNELRLGMLDAGECLVDDLRVTRNPDALPQQLIQNGTFDDLTKWRMLGNHRQSTIVSDGTGGNALRLRATGPAETNHNHAETTFTGNTALVDGQTYEVSLRARWLQGSPKLNVRSYYSRLANTIDLPVPQLLGTPGSANSRAVGAIGPALSMLRHTPVIPAAGQAITVTCSAADYRPITGLTLRYNAGAGFTAVTMTQADGLWSGTIPGQTAGTVIQFYAEGINNAGAVSLLPARGPDSRALCVVDDGQRSNVPAQELRVIMLPADRDFMLAAPNVVSNETQGGTLISGGADVFYDIGVRLQGSPASRARDGNDYISYNIELNADERWRGVYGSLGFDRSGRAPAVRRQDEIYAKHMLQRAGLPCTRDDLAYFVAPQSIHSGTVLLQLNGYNGQFVDDQFGEDAGSVFNYDATYEPTTASGGTEGIKNPTPFTHHFTDLTNLGTNKEQYRGVFDIRAGKGDDDYTGIMRLCQAMALPAPDFAVQAPLAADADEWMRCVALVNLLGVGDSWFTGGLPHNARFFTPHDGGPAVVLAWDMDFLFTTATTAPLNNATGNLRRFTDLPANQRAYLAHVRDLCFTAFDPVQLQPWLEHYGAVVGQNYAAQLAWITARRNHALSQLPASAPFAITTNGGADFSVSAHEAVLTGTGWIDIREIRRAGSSLPLAVKWTSISQWQAVVPLVSGANPLVIEAVAFDGTVLGTDTITITDTLVTPSPRDFLRVSEVMYHPADPLTSAEQAISTDADDFEFIELQNIGSETINIGGCQFVEGIDYTFPAAAQLAGGARILVVKNTAAFSARYGTGLPVSGQYPSDSLSNSGEVLTLIDATGTVIQKVAWSDAWAPRSDGSGYSLVLRNPAGAPASWLTAAGWSLSGTNGGTPAATNGPSAMEYALWRHTHFTGADLTNPAVSGREADPGSSGISNFLRYALGLAPGGTHSGLQPSIEPDGVDISWRRARAVVDVQWSAESSSDLSAWSQATITEIGVTDHGDGTETVKVRLPRSSSAQFYRLRPQ